MIVYTTINELYHEAMYIIIIINIVFGCAMEWKEIMVLLGLEYLENIPATIFSDIH